MAKQNEQRNVSLTPEQWAKLEEISSQTSSRSTRGPMAYQPSWRKLIQRIADGEIHLSEKEPYQIPSGLDRAIAHNKAQRRNQPALFETEPA